MRTLMILLGVLLLTACGGVAAPPTPTRALDAFRAAGLDVIDAKPLTRDELGLAPNTHEQAIIFTVVGGKCTPDKQCGARVFQFKNDADLSRTEAFYVEMGRSSAAFYSHTFRHGLLLMQINGDLPDDVAAKYGAALKTL